MSGPSEPEDTQVMRVWLGMAMALVDKNRSAAAEMTEAMRSIPDAETRLFHVSLGFCVTLAREIAQLTDTTPKAVLQEIALGLAGG